MQWRKARRGKEGEDKTPANHKQKGGLGVAGVGLGLLPMEAEV